MSGKDILTGSFLGILQATEQNYQEGQRDLRLRSLEDYRQQQQMRYAELTRKQIREENLAHATEDAVVAQKALDTAELLSLTNEPLLAAQENKSARKIKSDARATTEADVARMNDPDLQLAARETLDRQSREAIERVMKNAPLQAQADVLQSIQEHNKNLAKLSGFLKLAEDIDPNNMVQLSMLDAVTGGTTGRNIAQMRGRSVSPQELDMRIKGALAKSNMIIAGVVKEELENWDTSVIPSKDEKAREADLESLKKEVINFRAGMSVNDKDRAARAFASVQNTLAELAKLGDANPLKSAEQLGEYSVAMLEESGMFGLTAIHDPSARMPTVGKGIDRWHEWKKLDSKGRADTWTFYNTGGKTVSPRELPPVTEPAPQEPPLLEAEPTSPAQPPLPELSSTAPAPTGALLADELGAAPADAIVPEVQPAPTVAAAPQATGTAPILPYTAPNYGLPSSDNQAAVKTRVVDDIVGVLKSNGPSLEGKSPEQIERAVFKFIEAKVASGELQGREAELHAELWGIIRQQLGA